MDNRLLSLFLVLALAALISIPVMASNDEISLLFNSWMEGKPLGMVKIGIETPEVDDICFIAVHRFYTAYNPTKSWNQTEVIYRGKVRCGESVVVKDIIKMMQIGTRELNGEIQPVYDSPEYAVVVISKKGGFNRIIQTEVVKPITEVSVKVEYEKAEKKSVESQNIEKCEIYGNPYSCTVDVKLTYLNSIPGLRTAFGLEVNPPSAMYIEGWGSSCFSSDPNTPCPSSMWHSSGKKLAIAQIDDISPPISDGKRAIVWGNVEYRYERYAYWDDDFGIYWKYEFFYPVAIGALPDSQVIGNYYPPPSPPSYARGPIQGNHEIIFENPHQTDTKLSLSTSLSLNIGPVSFGISVSPYKSGNMDYSTPYIKVIDTSGNNYRWYYWWYRNNDPMSYEVEFWGS